MNLVTNPGPCGLYGHYGSETKWPFLAPDFGNQMTFFGDRVGKSEFFFGHGQVQAQPGLHAQPCLQGSPVLRPHPELTLNLGVSRI